jgi:hypothetical protein
MIANLDGTIVEDFEVAFPLHTAKLLFKRSVAISYATLRLNRRVGVSPFEPPGAREYLRR